jgi:hypothetical protein
MKIEKPKKNSQTLTPDYIQENEKMGDGKRCLVL